jgi:hypothetical protein
VELAAGPERFAGLAGAELALEVADKHDREASPT